MANVVPTTLFYKSARKFGVDVIRFDLMLEESHSLPSRITSHPVENGAPVSDHIEQGLQNGSLSGMITNFSLNTVGSAENRALTVFSAFEDLWKRRTLVTIVTGVKVYENVAISNVSTSRNANVGEALTFRVTFQKVRIVRLREVQVEANIGSNAPAEFATVNSAQTLVPLTQFESFAGAAFVRAEDPQGKVAASTAWKKYVVEINR